MNRTRLIALLCAISLALAMAACGGDDDDTSADGDPAETVAEPVDEPDGDTPEDSAAPEPDEDDGPDDAAPPAEDSGTITVAGTTTEVAGADFGICETVNPAFDDAFNIVTELSDGTPFRLNGDLEDMDPELDGLFLGDTFEEEQATDLDIGRDSRTISGTATVSAGEVEFSFTC